MVLPYFPLLDWIVHRRPLLCLFHRQGGSDMFLVAINAVSQLSFLTAERN